MIIYGNYHSNLCRILTTLCHELGMPCYMVHNTEDIKEHKETQNSRVIRAMGVREIPCGKTGIADAVQLAMDELTEKGYRPYYIYGNTKGQGREWAPMEAYAEAYEEICRQEEKKGLHFDYIFLASSTNATQAGLLAGSLKAGDNRKIIGISVSRNEKRGKEVLRYMRINLDIVSRKIWKIIFILQMNIWETDMDAILLKQRISSGKYTAKREYLLI